MVLNGKLIHAFPWPVICGIPNNYSSVVLRIQLQTGQPVIKGFKILVPCHHLLSHMFPARQQRAIPVMTIGRKHGVHLSSNQNVTLSTLITACRPVLSNVVATGHVSI